jgi:hypothetical protein
VLGGAAGTDPIDIARARIRASAVAATNQPPIATIAHSTQPGIIVLLPRGRT